ncbi:MULTISPECIES: MATE family efflux transporter [unclassified Lentimicrobium]|uniref:MATE family efflux transporter n=1 Tax=unclassified Lentimicrobium TaxID=2677434 RepID=UPI00155443EF|nr:MULTISPECIES: MATE family efflux transporter [unclassified Lentimicrobium]NPD47917.1 MATE family efflux transporter [Lentimicrobium sp. S6]NPD84468.1 MATE family efflux transporter [Lentimicrobium sp. L6]
MKDFTKGSETRLILNFAIPILFGSLFQQLYNIVDSIFIGNYVGKEGLAAVGASFPVIFALISFVIGIGSGSTVVISQYYGAKNNEAVKRAIDTLYIFMFFASAALSVLGIVFARQIFEFTDLPEDVLPQAVKYLQIYMSGNVLFFGFAGTNAILRGLGDSKTPLYFTIIATLINILLDWLFIGVFHWGVGGAAFATIIAQGGAFITGIIYLNKTHDLLTLHPSRLKFDKKIFTQSVKIGLPTGFQQTFVAFGMVALFGIVNKFGTDTVAAYSVGMRIDSVPAMLAMAFSAAVAPFVGQNIGANKPGRVRAGFFSTLILSTILTIIVTTVYMLFPRQIVMAFSDDAKVIEVGVEYIRVVAPFYVLFSLMFVVNGVLRGAGATLIPMFITLVALWFIRIPASYLMAEEMGRIGIWWGIPIGWFFGMGLAFVYYASGKWRNKSVTQ